MSSVKNNNNRDVTIKDGKALQSCNKNIFPNLYFLHIACLHHVFNGHTRNELFEYEKNINPLEKFYEICNFFICFYEVN